MRIVQDVPIAAVPTGGRVKKVVDMTVTRLRYAAAPEKLGFERPRVIVPAPTAKTLVETTVLQDKLFFDERRRSAHPFFRFHQVDRPAIGWIACAGHHFLAVGRRKVTHRRVRDE